MAALLSHGGMATISEIQERLALYRQAERSILEGGQEYRTGAVRFTRADLGRIQGYIRELEQQLAIAQSSGRLTHNVTVFGGRR